jgi:hypothetical protein
MIEPTVGRVVWFHAGGHETVMQSDQPLAAIVTYVHAHKHVDGKSPLVNLAVFGKEGSLWGRASVHLWDGDGEAPARGSYARWAEDEKPEDEAPKTPKREQGETDDAYKARTDRQRAEDRRIKQSEMDARGNMDHGPPRGSPSPFSGGPHAIDPHVQAAAPNAEAEAKAKADKDAADAKAKSDADAAKFKAAQADREARMTKWQGEKPQDGG